MLVLDYKKGGGKITYKTSFFATPFLLLLCFVVVVVF